MCALSLLSLLLPSPTTGSHTRPSLLLILAPSNVSIVSADSLDALSLTSRGYHCTALCRWRCINMRGLLDATSFPSYYLQHTFFVSPLGALHCCDLAGLGLGGGLGGHDGLAVIDLQVQGFRGSRFQGLCGRRVVASWPWACEVEV